MINTYIKLKTAGLKKTLCDRCGSPLVNGGVSNQVCPNYACSDRQRAKKKVVAESVTVVIKRIQGVNNTSAIRDKLGPVMDELGFKARKLSTNPDKTTIKYTRRVE